MSTLSISQKWATDLFGVEDAAPPPAKKQKDAKQKQAKKPKKNKLHTDVDRRVTALEADVAGLKSGEPDGIDPDLLKDLGQRTANLRTEFTRAKKNEDKLNAVGTRATRMAKEAKGLRAGAAQKPSDAALVKLVRARAEWQAAHAAASQRLDDLTAQPLGDPSECVALLRDVTDAVTNSGGADAAAYQAATKQLHTQFKPASERALQAVETAKAARRQAFAAVEAAEKKAQEILLLADYCDPKDALSLVALARQELDAARTEAQFQSAFARAHQASSKLESARLDAAPARRAEQDFDRALQSAEADLAALRQLPCADTYGPLKAAADRAKAAIDEATQTVDGPKVKDNFEKAVGLLALVAHHLREARSAAKDAEDVLKTMQDAEAELKKLDAVVAGHKAVNYQAVTTLIAEARNNLARAQNVADAKQATAGLKDKGLMGGGLAGIDKIKSGPEFKKLKEVRAETTQAKARLAQMAALPGAGTILPLKEQLDKTRNRIAANDGAAAADLDGLSKALKELQAVKDDKAEAKKLSEAGVTLVKQLAVAEAKVVEQERHAFLDATGLRGTLDTARKSFEAANTLDAARGALDPLKKLDKDIETVRAGKADLLKQRAGYDAERLSARDCLAEVEKLRDAEKDVTLKGIVANLRATLAAADGAAARATTEKELEDAASKFKAFPAAREEAKKRAEELAQGVEHDTKALPAYAKHLANARKAATRAAGLPGAGAQVTALSALIQTAEAKLHSDGEMTRGHAAALSLLKDKGQGYAKLLKDAEAAAAGFKPDPRVAPEVKKAAEKFTALEGVASAAVVARFRADLAAAQEQSVTDADAALKEIDRLARKADDEHKQQAEDRAEVEAMQGDLAELCKQIAAVAPRDVNERLKRTLQGVATNAVPGRKWAEALEILKPALAEATAWSQAKPAHDAWKQKSAALAETIDRARAVADSCPAFSREAGPLLGGLNLLKKQVEADADYLNGVKTFDELQAKVADLETRARATVAPGVDLKALAKSRKDAQELVNKADSIAMAAVWEFEQSEDVKAVKNKDRIKASAERQKVLDDWQAFLDKGTTDSAAIVTKGKAAAVALMSVKAALEKTKTDAAARSEQLAPAVAADADRSKEEQPARIERLLAAVVRCKGDVSAERKQYDQLRQASPADPVELTKLEAALKAKFEQAKAAALQNAGKARAANDALRKKLEKKKRGKFSPFYKKLDYRLGDVQMLLTSGDPDLIAQGIADVARLEKVLSDAQSEHLKAVNKQVKQAGKMVGKEVLRKRCKAQHWQLREKLNRTIAAAMEEPDKAPDQLQALTQEIAAAIEEAKRRDLSYQEYKKERKALLKLHKSLAEATRAGVKEAVGEALGGAGRVEAYEAKLKALLAEANELAHTDEPDALKQAHDKLAAIRTELMAIRDSADPRGKLQEANGKAKQEQRLAKDLAEQFNAEFAAFEKVLQATKQKVEEAGADKGPIEQLRLGAQGAAKVVEPYTNAVSGWPHEKSKGQAADPPAKVLQAFRHARKQLADLTRAAEQLAKDPNGAEVADPGDLPALELELRTRSKKLHKAVGELLAKVNEASGEWPGTLPDDAPKDALSKTEAEDTSKKLTAYFADLKLRFPLKQLRRPLEILKDTTTDPQTRKRARELALRHIHHMTRDLLRDEILKELRKNPYRPLTTELTLVRGSLKSLELAVLTGI